MTRGVLLLGVVLLYVASIPWYRSPDSEVDIVLGLPDWVAAALGCYLAAAVLNALAWLRTDVPDVGDVADVGNVGDEPPEDEGP